MIDDQFYKTIEEFRTLAFKKIDETIRKKEYSSNFLYGILPEYPSRKGKGLRPALCLGACSSVGGNIYDAINSAAAIELFHNAFLVKDDIEDGSEFRRNDKTIVAKYGSSVAINVGDALAVLAIKLLIDNVEKIGVHQTLNIVDEIQQMALRTVEGQAIELQWISENRWELKNSDYYKMCTKKTSWYTTATPCRIGAKIGSPDISEDKIKSLTKFALNLGLAFQIQDDILNLVGNKTEYGKEINGDLLEGKRTLIMIILYNSATKHEKREIRNIYSTSRRARNSADVGYIRNLLKKYNCLEKSAQISNGFVKKAIRIINEECEWMSDKKMMNFMKNLALYVVERDK